MNTTALPYSPTPVTRRVASHRLVRALIDSLLAVDAWLAARRQRANDLRTLAQMSDYELRDLGLHRLDTLSASSVFNGHDLR